MFGKSTKMMIALGFMLLSPYLGLALLSRSFNVIDEEYLLEACRGVTASGVCTMEEARAFYPPVELARNIGLVLLLLALLTVSFTQARIPERAVGTWKMMWEGTPLLWKILRVFLLLAFAWVIYVNYFQ